MVSISCVSSIVKCQLFGLRKSFGSIKKFKGTLLKKDPWLGINQDSVIIGKGLKGKSINSWLGFKNNWDVLKSWGNCNKVSEYKKKVFGELFKFPLKENMLFI